MPRCAAFLRGINLGRRRVTNADLRSCVEAMGFSDVDVFGASGNVVFGGAGRSPAKTTERLEQGLERALGFEVVTFLRTAAEVAAIAAAEPFPAKQLAASDGKLQVAILAARPPKRARDQVLAMATGDDRLVFGDRELYWLPAGGFAESELNRDQLAELLGPMTFRTKNMIERLARKHFTS